MRLTTTATCTSRVVTAAQTLVTSRWKANAPRSPMRAWPRTIHLGPYTTNLGAQTTNV